MCERVGVRERGGVCMCVCVGRWMSGWMMGASYTRACYSAERVRVFGNARLCANLAYRSVTVEARAFFYSLPTNVK